MALAGFAIFLLGLIFVIVAPINKRKNTRCTAQTQGTLGGIYRRGSTGTTKGHSYVYSYEVDGTEYQIKSTILGKGASNIGDTCTIWYDPKKPKKAQPFHYESVKIYNILIIVGIVMVLGGLILMIAGVATQ